MTTYLLFFLGFFILLKGAEFLVDGSTSIAKRLKISNIVIGLTIVSFGTSSPELIVNIIASAHGNSDIAIGNVLGSNIANILLILGISSIIYPITAKKNTALKEIPFSLLAILVLGLMCNDHLIDGRADSVISRIDGSILLAFFIIFIYYTFEITKSKDDIIEKKERKEFGYPKSIFFIILGILGLLFGGRWIVDGAVEFAEMFNVSQSLIGLTIIAIGTSLPELATSAVAAYKKQSDIAIGNAVGSNIFNIFAILGISSLINPLPFNLQSNFDIAVTIFASILLFGMMFVFKKQIISRLEGVIMVILYFIYILYLILSQH